VHEDRIHILLAEDSRTEERLVRHRLRSQQAIPYHLAVVDKLSSALHHLENNPVDLLLLDLNLRDSQGAETLKAVREINPDVAVIVLTAMDDAETASACVQAGASDYLVKSRYNANRLGLSIQLATRHARTRNELRALNRELESRVSERTRQLQAANAELEAFSYSISHDLRAPLRGVQGLAGILKEDFADALGEKGSELCDLISERTARMERMINELLSFSKIGRCELRKRGVDMKMLAGEAFAEVCESEERAKGKIAFSIEELPSIEGDQDLLRLVWVNLLSNAVKFSAKREQPEITVSAKTDGNWIVYSVRDNGIGFKMAQSDRLFGVFSRLHSNNDFPGTGVGLANVRRIIERHEGCVWAHAKPGEGATFAFALPSGSY
jgi:signal transduction histidine kinase